MRIPRSLAWVRVLARERVRRWTLAQTLAFGFDGDGPSRRRVEVATWLHEARSGSRAGRISRR